MAHGRAVMRSWLSLVVLLSAVLGLSAWIYFKPAALHTDGYALSTLKPREVKRIQLTRARGDAAPAVIERGNANGGWRMSAPIAARVDPIQVERLLSVLDAHSAVRYASDDRGRFGLDNPIATLRIDDQQFTYGAVNATTREQYVLTNDAVYAVPLGTAAMLPRNAEALLAKDLFAPGESPSRFELPGFSVVLENGAWTVNPQSGASADVRNAWVDAWRHATAMQAAPHDGRASTGEIRIGLRDGRTLVLAILQREPELALLRIDEGVQYYFVAAAAKRLLSPPGARLNPDAK